MDDWNKAKHYFKENFDPHIDLSGIIYIIGVQELGKGPGKFNKDQKIDLMHIAICTLLEPYGYYSYQGNDKDGWPHFEPTESLPQLKPLEQERLVKSSIFDYLKSNGLL